MQLCLTKAGGGGGERKRKGISPPRRFGLGDEKGESVERRFKL